MNEERFYELERKVNFLYLSELTRLRNLDITQINKNTHLMGFNERIEYLAKVFDELNKKYPDLEPLK